ncbi:MAG: hypothetical protein H0V30_04200 [Chitinophagaceae bacterium]|jgi:hypothetical protein|nr:hypothetical protein [Chitinophagaceae bacterium]
MKFKQIISVALILIIAACSKDKFTTAPQIEIISMSTDIVPANSGIRFTLEFRDKEGDMNDSLFIKKVRLNQRVVETNLDSFWTKIPEFPKHTEGQFLVDLNYQTIISATFPPSVPGNPNERESDTLVVKFLAKDAEGNKSDTVTSDQIIVIRQ